MTGNKSLEELGREYEEQAELLREKIDRTRKKMKGLDGRSCSKQVFLCRAELRALYRQHRDVVETAHRLVHYYDGTKKENSDERRAA